MVRPGHLRVVVRRADGNGNDSDLSRVLSAVSCVARRDVSENHRRPDGRACPGVVVAHDRGRGVARRVETCNRFTGTVHDLCMFVVDEPAFRSQIAGS